MSVAARNRIAELVAHAQDTVDRLKRVAIVAAADPELEAALERLSSDVGTLAVTMQEAALRAFNAAEISQGRPRSADTRPASGLPLSTEVAHDVPVTRYDMTGRRTTDGGQASPSGIWKTRRSWR